MKKIITFIILIALGLSFGSCGENKDIKAMAASVYEEISEAYQWVVTADCDIRGARDLAITNADGIVEQGYQFFTGKLQAPEDKIKNVVCIFLVDALDYDIDDLTQSDFDDLEELARSYYFPIAYDSMTSINFADHCAYIYQVYYASELDEFEKIMVDARKALQSMKNTYPDSKYIYDLERYLQAVDEYAECLDEDYDDHKQFVSVLDTAKAKVDECRRRLTEGLKLNK